MTKPGGHHHHDDCGHHHGHGHSHGHAPHPQDGHRHHSHHHAPTSFDRTFAFAAAINMGFVLIELGYGFFSNSLGLIADAAHNFSDVIGLLLAWGGAFLARLNPTAERTYGYSGASILAALGNAGLLFLATGAIIVQALQRFWHPAPIAAHTVIYVALVGIVVNGMTAMMFHKDHKHDLNMRGVYLHMLGDAGISLGVVIAAVIVSFTNWLWIDPLISLAIAGVVVFTTWDLAKEALHLSLAGVPKHIDTDKVSAFLMSLPGVTEIHDLHIWGMSTTKTALTVHLMRPEAGIDDAFLHYVAKELESRFQIQHPTIQLEKGDDAEACKFAPANVI